MILQDRIISKVYNAECGFSGPFFRIFETANCSFMGNTHISEEISRCH